MNLVPYQSLRGRILPWGAIVHWLAQLFAAKNSESRAGDDGAAPVRKAARLRPEAVTPPPRSRHGAANRRTRLAVSSPSGVDFEPFSCRRKISRIEKMAQTTAARKWLKPLGLGTLPLNLRSENRGFGLAVRVGGCSTQSSRLTSFLVSGQSCSP